MAFPKETTKGCIICGGALERANVSSVCNSCKDAMSGKQPAKGAQGQKGRKR